MKTAAANDADAAVVDGWWAELCARNRLPSDLAPVQVRRIRGVYRGHLPSGPVHVKAMAFPRAKDRLRYAVRALPAAHEAAMLAAVAAAGIPAPEVVAVRTARRGLLPFRSLLVLRTLPVVPDAQPLPRRVRDEATLAARMLAAGIEHRDLHAGNFVRLDDGRLAVLDLQSAHRVGVASALRPASRIALGATMLRVRPPELAQELVAAGLLHDDREAAAAVAAAAVDDARFAQLRIDRCLHDCTEFARSFHWWGAEHRLRGAVDGLRWHDVGGEGVPAWRGQRDRMLAKGGAPAFVGLRRRWPWLGGRTWIGVDPSTAAGDVARAVAEAAAAWRSRASGSRR
jgi:hypothetical protein